MTNALIDMKKIRQTDANSDEAADNEESQHELLEKIDENTKFFLLKIPNKDCLMQSLTCSEIALTDQTAKAVEAALSKLKEEDSLVLFVSIQGSDWFNGVCVSSLKQNGLKLGTEVREEWRQYWQGTFKAVLKVTWLIPICLMPFAKVNHLVQPVIAQSNAMRLQQMLNAADGSVSAASLDQDLFNQRRKNLIEMPHDTGMQMSKTYIEWQKQKIKETDQPL